MHECVQNSGFNSIRLDWDEEANCLPLDCSHQFIINCDVFQCVVDLSYA